MTTLVLVDNTTLIFIFTHGVITFRKRGAITSGLKEGRATRIGLMHGSIGPPLANNRAIVLNNVEEKMEFKEWLEARVAEPVQVAKTINRLLSDLRIVKEKVKIMGGVASPIVANQLVEAANALHKARVGVESAIEEPEADPYADLRSQIAADISRRV
jgi:hypothetical protein